MEYFNLSEIEGSDRAHDLQHILGYPSYQHIINAISKNLVINCPLLSDDVRCAHAIYGISNAILKREMVRNNPKHIEFKQRIPLQADILKNHI